MNSLLVVAQFITALAGHLSGAVGAGSDTIDGSPWLLLAGLFGAAALLAVVAVVAFAVPLGMVPDARTLRRPSQNADLTTLVTQSHPAAPGHVRSRAPGRPARAA